MRTLNKIGNLILLGAVGLGLGGCLNKESSAAFERNIRVYVINERINGDMYLFTYSKDCHRDDSQDKDICSITPYMEVDKRDGFVEKFGFYPSDSYMSLESIAIGSDIYRMDSLNELEKDGAISRGNAYLNTIRRYNEEKEREALNVMMAAGGGGAAAAAGGD